MQTTCSDLREEWAAVKDAVLSWCCANPGQDAETVAEKFGIPLTVADDMLNELLASGALEFVESG